MIEEPIYVIGKRICIKGACSGLKDKNGPITYLIGPPPQQVLDEERNVILSAKAVVGLINLIGADVVIQDMRIPGFDAGFVLKYDYVKSENIFFQIKAVRNFATGITLMSVLI